LFFLMFARAQGMAAESRSSPASLRQAGGRPLPRFTNLGLPVPLDACRFWFVRPPNVSTLRSNSIASDVLTRIRMPMAQAALTNRDHGETRMESPGPGAHGQGNDQKPLRRDQTPSTPGRRLRPAQRHHRRKNVAAGHCPQHEWQRSSRPPRRQTSELGGARLRCLRGEPMQADRPAPQAAFEANPLRWHDE